MPYPFQLTYENTLTYITDQMKIIHELSNELSDYKKSHHKYEPNHVFDRTQSIIWNEEQVKHENAVITGHIGAYHAKLQKEEQRIVDCIKHYIKAEYDFPTSICDLIYNATYEDSHAYGYKEVLNHISTYADFAEKIINAVS